MTIVLYYWEDMETKNWKDAFGKVLHNLTMKNMGEIYLGELRRPVKTFGTY